MTLTVNDNHKKNLMMSDPLRLEVPFVWPDPRALRGTAGYDGLSPIEPASIPVNSVFGLVADLSAEGLMWLENFLEEKESSARLILALYPACATGSEDLSTLFAIQERSSGRAQFRVRAAKIRGEPIANVLSFRGRNGGPGFMVCGSAGNLGFYSGKSSADINLAFRPEPLLLDRFRNLFDFVWSTSARLTERSCAIPALEPALGDPDAAEMWRQYEAKCVPDASHPDEKVDVSPETGEVIYLPDPGNPRPRSPTAEIGVEALGELRRELAAIYAKGALVTIEKTSRIRPLDVPVRPAWFGMESFSQAGAVSRRVSFSVSPFDETKRKEMDKLRRRPAELVPRFSYLLADGVRWMPNAARALYESELQRASAQWTKLIGAAVSGGADAFVNAQRDRIRRDADDMYRTVNPTGRLSDSALDEILTDMKRRLERAIGGNSLIPRISYTPLQYNAEDSLLSSGWGQSYTLLKSIAEFARDYYTDRFFMQGLELDEDAYVSAMDVGKDLMLSDQGKKGARQRGKDETETIRRLDESDVDARIKCEAIWLLIRKGSSDGIERLHEANCKGV